MVNIPFVPWDPIGYCGATHTKCWWDSRTRLWAVKVALAWAFLCRLFCIAATTDMTSQTRWWKTVKIEMNPMYISKKMALHSKCSLTFRSRQRLWLHDDYYDYDYYYYNYYYYYYYYYYSLFYSFSVHCFCRFCFFGLKKGNQKSQD